MCYGRCFASSWHWLGLERSYSLAQWFSPSAADQINLGSFKNIDARVWTTKIMTKLFYVGHSLNFGILQNWPGDWFSTTAWCTRKIEKPCSSNGLWRRRHLLMGIKIRLNHQLMGGWKGGVFQRCQRRNVCQSFFPLVHLPRVFGTEATKVQFPLPVNKIKFLGYFLS